MWLSLVSGFLVFCWLRSWLPGCFQAGLPLPALCSLLVFFSSLLLLLLLALLGFLSRPSLLPSWLAIVKGVVVMSSSFDRSVSSVSVSEIGLPAFAASYAPPAPAEVAGSGSLPAAWVLVDNLGEPVSSLCSPVLDSALLSDDLFVFAVVDSFVCDPVAFGAWAAAGFSGALPVPAGVDPFAGSGIGSAPEAVLFQSAGVRGGVLVVCSEDDGFGLYAVPDLPAAPAFVPFSVPGCRFACKESLLDSLPVGGVPGASRSLVSVSVVAEVVLAWDRFRAWSASLLDDQPWLASRAGLLGAIGGGYDGLSVILVRPVSLSCSVAGVGGVLVDPSGYSYARYACRLLPAPAAPDPVPAPSAVPSYPLSLEMDAAAAAAAEEAEAAVRVAVRSAVAGLEFDLLAAAGSLDPEILSVLSSLAPNDLVVSGLGSVAAAAYESAVAAARSFLVAVAAAAER